MISRTIVSNLNQDVTKWFVQKIISRTATSTAAQSIPLTDDNGTSQPLPFFRTKECKPSNHIKNYSGLFYTISPDIRKQLFLYDGLPKQYVSQVDTFQEMCVMVREPALELMSYLKTANYSSPTVRYVLYGKQGYGKSLTLAHLLHYGLEAGFLLVHVPWIPNWFTRPKECADSTTKEGFVDLPLDAASWLIHFKTQNATLLKTLQLSVSEDYVWSKRERTNKGAPLLDLIELGISRVKYSSDCIGVVLKEVKQYSELGRCKTLVVLDGFNAFFYPSTHVTMANRTKVSPLKVSLTQPFLDVSKLDWCNGAVIVTVDTNAVGNDRRKSFLPRYLLGKEGFEHLDPFIPVEVGPYTEKELESCIAYYADRKWITHPKGSSEEGIKELGFLSAMNPYQLMRLCASI